MQNETCRDRYLITENRFKTKCCNDSSDKELYHIRKLNVVFRVGCKKLTNIHYKI